MCDYCLAESCFHGHEDSSCGCDIQGNSKCPSCGCTCKPWWSDVNFPEGVQNLLGDTLDDETFFPTDKTKIVQSVSSDGEWLNQNLREGTYRNGGEIASALVPKVDPIAWNKQPTDLIWKEKSKSLLSGQKIIVGQGQVSVMLASSGKVCDRLGEGEHVMSKESMPLLAGESRKSLPNFEHYAFDGSPVFFAPEMEFEVSITSQGQTKALRNVMARGLARLKILSPELFLQKLSASKKNSPVDTTSSLAFIDMFSSDVLRKEMSTLEYDELTRNSGEVLEQRLSARLKDELGLETVKITFDSVGEFGRGAFMMPPPSAASMQDPKNREEMRKWAESMRQSQMGQLEAIRQMQQARMAQVPPQGPQAASTKTNVCSSCGTPNPPASKFCNNCGKALSRTCPKCGQAVAPSVKFCGNCGANLSTV
jgi:Double zinc ribbon